MHFGASRADRRTHGLYRTAVSHTTTAPFSFDSPRPFRIRRSAPTMPPRSCARSPSSRERARGTRRGAERRGPFTSVIRLDGGDDLHAHQRRARSPSSEDNAHVREYIPERHIEEDACFLHALRCGIALSRRARTPPPTPHPEPPCLGRRTSI